MAGLPMERRGKKWDENENYHYRDNRPKAILQRSSRMRQPRMLPHFCKQDVMHICTAKDKPDRQRACHFYLKATGVVRCMDLTFDEYCTNHILHRYVAGGISDQVASKLMKTEKRRLAKIQKKAEGYNVDFPLDGEETIEDVQYVFEQLVDLGLTTPEFWMDENGKSANEYDNFNVTVEDVINGKWCPKRKELRKDILKYFDLRRKFRI